MTNANLVEHLSRQTRRPVGLTPYAVVDDAPEAIARHWADLQNKGIQISIVDCLSEDHAQNVTEAAAGLQLITGGSAFGTHLPRIWRRRAWLTGASPTSVAGSSNGCGALVVAGSCSVATASQNAWLSARGAMTIEADPIGLLLDRTQPMIDAAVQALRKDSTVLLKTHSNAEAIAQTREWGLQHGLEGAALGLRIANALALTTQAIIDSQQPRTLISAGGETSSAICRALGIRALAVGRNIQPGVPLCLPIEGRKIPLVLKSGNFGTQDFYGAAINASGAAASLK
jgi:uncharacterized protein YgbK (DUF1537 family)